MTRKQPKTNRYVLDASVVKARLKELNTNASAVSLKAGMSATYLSNCLGRGVNLNQPTVMAIARELLITDWESIVLHEQPVAPESEWIAYETTTIAYETTTSAERESQNAELISALIESNKAIEAQLAEITKMVDMLGRAVLILNSTYKETHVSNVTKEHKRR